MTAADDLLALDQRHVWHPFTQAATAPAPIPIRSARVAHHPGLTRPRVCGTIAAVSVGGAEQGHSAALGNRLRAFFLERGLLIRPLGSTVYLLPPYCVSSEELHRAYDAIEEAAATLS